MTPEKIVEAILPLSMSEIMKVVNSLKEKLGISDIMLQGGGGAAVAAPGAAAPVVEEKTEFSVYLTGVKEGVKKVKVVSPVRTLVAGLSLLDAKKIVDNIESAPYELKANVSKAEAEKVKKDLEEVGGIVEIK
jgi:large subunit ribosomal protein L7/L12